MLLRFFFCLILSFTAARGEDAVVHVGGKALRIPTPKGFVRYDGQSDKIDAMQASFVPPSNHILAAYGEQSDLEKVLTGKFPRLIRSFNVQENAQLKDTPITPEDFTAVKNSLKEQMDKLKNVVRPTVTDVEKSASSTMSRALGSTLKLKVGEIFPQDLFSDTANGLGFSMLVHSRVMGDPLNESIDHTTYIAGSVTLVQDRLLYLYANSNYRGKDDSEWARKQIVAWRNAVQAANSPEAPKLVETPPVKEERVLPPEPAADNGAAPSHKTPWLVAGGGALLVLGWLMLRRKPLKLPGEEAPK